MAVNTLVQTSSFDNCKRAMKPDTDIHEYLFQHFGSRQDISKAYVRISMNLAVDSRGSFVFFCFSHH